MCGCGLPTEEAIERAISSFRSCLGVRDDDQAMLVASGRTLFIAGHAWSGTQRGVGKGKDGADLEILRRCDVAHIATRFTSVVLASGDHIFAPLVLALQDAGVQVTIVARTGSISSALRRTRAQVRHLPEHAAASNELETVWTDKLEELSEDGGGRDGWDARTPVLTGAGSGR